MDFVFSENYNIYPVGFAMSFTGYTWHSAVGLETTGNSIDILEKSDGDNMLSLTAKGTFCGICTWFERKTDSYIFETDVCLKSINAALDIYVDIRDSSDKKCIYTVNSDNSPINEWFRLAVKINLCENIAEIYICGASCDRVSLNIAEKAPHDKTDVVFIKIAARGTEDKASVVLIDNTALYEGGEFCPQEDWIDKTKFRFAPAADYGINTKRIESMLLLGIGTAAVKRFGKNDRIDNNRNAMPCKVDGKVMLPWDYIKSCYNILNNPEDGKLYLKDNIQYISAENAAELTQKELKLYACGLIALGDKKDFFDVENEKEIVELIYKLLFATSKELPLFTNDSDFDEIIKKVKIEKYPFSRAWEEIRKNADNALISEYPMILQGYVQHYMQTALAAAGAARDLALCWRVTGDEKYAKRAKELLIKWSEPENPLPVFYTKTCDVNGLVTSRSMVPFAYAYSMLYPVIEEEDRAGIEAWFIKMAQGMIRANESWCKNDYFEKQYYQNHIVIHMMGIVILGLVTRNIDLLMYALYPEGENFSYSKLIEGAIIGIDDDEIFELDPCFTHNWSKPQPGEVYDRYRARVGKGLHYSSLNARCLLLTAEALFHYGYDYFSYKGAHGEQLNMPFEFYSDFYLERDNSIKGGYYSTSILHNHECYIFPIAARRYPESKKLYNFCKKAPVAQLDSEQLGWTAALTHSIIDADEKKKNLPDIDRVFVNGTEISGFSKDCFVYYINRSDKFEIQVMGLSEYDTKVTNIADDVFSVKIADGNDLEVFGEYIFKMKENKLANRLFKIAATQEGSGSCRDKALFWTVIDLTEDTKVKYLSFKSKGLSESDDITIEAAPFHKDIWKSVSGVRLECCGNDLYKLDFDKQNCRYLKVVVHSNNSDIVEFENVEAYNIR